MLNIRSETPPKSECTKLCKQNYLQEILLKLFMCNWLFMVLLVLPNVYGTFYSTKHTNSAIRYIDSLLDFSICIRNRNMTNHFVVDTFHRWSNGRMILTIYYIKYIINSLTTIKMDNF